MTTEAMSTTASLQRPESDFEVSSSYVPSLASPTTRDSIDEGYDPDETLKIIVYDNEQIEIKSRGMYYSPSIGEPEEEDQNDDDDDQDVEFYDNISTSAGPNLNQLRHFLDATTDISDDDDEDVIFISSQELSRTDNEQDPDVNANVIINPVQLHESYEDEQDVELHPALLPMPSAKDLVSFENADDIDAFDQLDNDYLIAIGPNKFSMVRDDENGGKIEVLDIKDKIDYGELDQNASLDSNVKVCTDILRGINFDQVSLASIHRVRQKNKKLQRMSNITSLDSDTRVFNEIWNAVKEDKFESQPNSFDSDTKVFNAITKGLKNYDSIPEEGQSCPSSTGSWALPENPGSSPVYYPASQINPNVEENLVIDLEHQETQEASKNKEKTIDALRGHCSSRIELSTCPGHVSSIDTQTENQNDPIPESGWTISCKL